MLLPRKSKRKADDGANDKERRKGRPGRGMKHPKDIAAPRRTVRQQQRILQEQWQGRVDAAEYDLTKPAGPDHQRILSPLERLPNEIIQQIFFSSLETNLALTSWSLNETLSGDSVFRSLILLAYFDPSTHPCLDADVEKKLFLPAQYRRLENDERRDLQRSILGFRWCSLARIRDCMPVLSRLAVIAAARRERRDLEANGPFRWLAPDSLPTLPADEDYQILRHRYSASITDTPYDLLQQALGRPLADQTGVDDTLPFLRVPSDPALDDARSLNIDCPVLGALYVPDRLLCGAPWTDEKLALLQLLRQGLRAGKVNIATPWTPGQAPCVSVSAMFVGMANAMKEHRRDALLTLLELYCDLRGTEHWDRDDGELAAYSDDGRAPPVHPPPHLFHLATKSGDSASDFVKLLIRAELGAIPGDDEILTAWAVRAEATGSAIGRWVLRRMEFVPPKPRGRLGFFYRGACLGGPSETPTIFGDELFEDEIGFINPAWISRVLYQRSLRS